jgi:putative tricarboxylic transport membrane protein
MKSGAGGRKGTSALPQGTGGMAELFFNILLIIILVILYLSSLGIRGRQISSDHFGPQGFPQILIALSVLLLIWVSFRVAKQVRKESQLKEKFNRGFFKRPIFLCLLILGAYAAFLNLAGYLLSTLLFIFLMGKGIGYSKNLRLVLFSVVTAGILVLVFGRLFGVPLPRGMGWLRELSFFIY